MASRSMTDDERHAETMAVLLQIRDALTELLAVTRERLSPPPLNPFGALFIEALKGITMPRPTPMPTSQDWATEITTVSNDPLLLMTAGTLWRWQPGVQRAFGPLCPSDPDRELLAQNSAAGAPVPVTDATRIGIYGWLVCPVCARTYAVPGLFTVGVIRAAMETAFRGRLGLGVKG